MRQLDGKVAVVTGAASGIGRALAERSAQEGMKVVLADVERDALAKAEAELKAAGATVLAVPTDVSKLSDVEALAQQTLAAFGGVHLLFNNAGVGGGSTVWESTISDWQWIVGVNLWGVIHGVKVFVPIMLEQGGECHVVNTASEAGLIAGPGLALYKVTKHAVVSLSETLYYELGMRNADVKVSVVCPSWVKTRIGESGRNRPPELADGSDLSNLPPDQMAMAAQVWRAIQSGMDPLEVADLVFRAIRDERLYILTNPEEARTLVAERLGNIVEQRNPEIPAELSIPSVSRLPLAS